MPEQPRIAVFASFSGQGGVERMIVNLCKGLAQRGCRLDLVLVKSVSAHLEELPAAVRVISPRAGHTLGSVLELARYLRRERPVALLAAKERAGRTALAARWLARVPTRVVVRIGTTLSAALEGRSRLRKWTWHLPMRLFYPHFDGVVAVSDGVAKDLAAITRLPLARFQVIRNPVITPRLQTLAAEPVDHPWLVAGEVPVIMGVGRFTRQKDFPTLLKAFALVRRERLCRLIILGNGRSRADLLSLAADLGIADAVDFPGFAANPYKYLARASLFVLSSAWEGSPNALTEALALGVPVVATDCPSGPREILAEGRFGPLVPIGDSRKMAEAIVQVMTAPLAADCLRQAAAAYSMEESSRRYLEMLIGPDISKENTW